MLMSSTCRTILSFVVSFGASFLFGCEQHTPKAQGGATPAVSASSQDDTLLKVAFVYLGPIGDGGWTYSHEHARRVVQVELGDKIKTSYAENVPEGAAAERVFRDLAKQGNQIIFGTTFGYAESMLKVAKEFPTVKFHHATGEETADNVSVYAARTYEGAYLSGVLAAKATKTNRLGFVASFPIPEVIRNINAYTLGAQSVNPAITTRVAWVGKWFDPEKERESALYLIAQGADVLLQNTDSPAVLKTAQEKGVMAFGWSSDMSQYGPKAHLGSAVVDWAPYYKKVVLDVLEGNWANSKQWLGARENVIKISSPNPGLQHDVLLFLGEKMHAIKTRNMKPFDGPVADRNGNEVVASGASLDDKSLKNMKFYVKGVDASPPL
jgi:basic membrane protein A